MSFAEKLATEAAAVRLGPPCTTCKTLSALSVSDRADYDEAVASGVSASLIARALGLQPGTYRRHMSSCSAR